MSQTSDPTAGGGIGLPAPDPSVSLTTTDYPVGDPLGTAVTVPPTAPPSGGGDASKTEVAKEAASVAKEGAMNVAGEAKQHAGALVGEATEHARGVLSQAVGQAREQGDQQASRAAGSLRTFSEQARALSEGRTEEAGRLGEFVTRAGDQAQQFASRLDSEGLQGVANDISKFARRRPGLFLAAAAGVGFLAGRTLRANQAANQNDSESRTTYSSGYEPGYGGTYTQAPVGGYASATDPYATSTGGLRSPDAGTGIPAADVIAPGSGGLDPLLGEPPYGSGAR